ncbi:hypothetical protein SPRG_17459 [Saprolegnia parasitica CBS 223.65]|uniref:C2 domain-containing protein n=1 Tax=Saprolegnia parasitica (strain CBS 223.65) TaxID=695850 RepID=A0A067BQU2_SAPPC|nr:hypothetical protein SPRG_17459 [Saprolegnia parasitica CBS 223.65]KDO17052.1 hypothetical protein SPRG_17459 [Saprolegnia parasitica CBS 223.65]|eukprot:XP_012212239.1 hypothetical protein SPRG_17459 [Saprolegnia parasitica CBS 223.65]
MSSILKVQLHKATDLPVADMALTGGKSDPYLVFILNDQTYRTPCIASNLNPIWSNETFQFRVNDTSGILRVEVWDDDNFRPDDLLGVIDIPLSTVEKGLKKEEDSIKPYAVKVVESLQKQNVSPHVFMSIALLTPVEAVALLDFEVWENERWSRVRRTWAKANLTETDPKEWSSSDGSESSTKFEDVIPTIPPRYEPINTWHYVKHIGDKDGWIYGPTFDGPWYEVPNLLHIVRRRRWINAYKRDDFQF